MLNNEYFFVFIFSIATNLLREQTRIRLSFNLSGHSKNKVFDDIIKLFAETEIECFFVANELVTLTLEIFSTF